ncbi:hypothetical protein JCM6882_009385 [Rhodosporidiobolus microsporus]
MGCAGSTPSAAAAADSAETKLSAAIDEELRRAKKEQQSLTKALLLGAGESGKSTICKQMRLIYAKPYSEEEKKQYREIVWVNTLQSAQAVISAFPLLSLHLPASLEPSVTLLRNLSSDAICEPGPGGEEVMRPVVADALQKLWNEEATKRVVERSAAFQLNDSASYFFDALPRLSAPSYLPSTQDVLRTRVQSTGIVEETFRIKELGRSLMVVDVGGQRSERKKWIHCFENVNVLIFVVAISEYAQVLYEDNTVNRLDEAAQLWESIAASRWFSRTTFVLFLNKLDLFTLKMRSPLYPLSKYMSDFTPSFDGDVDAGKRYMKDKFTALNKSQQGGRALYTHFTCATDTESTRVVLGAVMTSILTSRLDSAGLM